MLISNRVRHFSYLAGVVVKQLNDPFCRKCKALVNTAGSARTDLAQFEQEQGRELEALPPDMLALLSAARRLLADIVLEENLVGQKKTGNCKLPEGICFVKSARHLLHPKN